MIQFVEFLCKLFMQFDKFLWFDTVFARDIVDILQALFNVDESTTVQVESVGIVSQLVY